MNLPNSVCKIAAFSVSAALAAGLAATLAFAAHPLASLPGSNFEIDEDANLKQQDAGSAVPEPVKAQKSV